MRLRRCSCGVPVVIVGGLVENERPTGTWHFCEQAFGYDEGTPQKGWPPRRSNVRGPDREPSGGPR